MTLPEVLLWQRLKGSPTGVRFRKQHPIDPYIVDFYCSDRKLIIEIDGIVHDMGDRPDADCRRRAFLEAHGYQLLRIPAAEVLKNPDAVAEGLIALAMTPLHHPADGPPPRPGEDL